MGKHPILYGVPVGRCSYAPRGVASCLTPATVHLWFEDGDDSATSYACATHANEARRDAADEHPVDSTCLEINTGLVMWHWSEGERVGWCYRPDVEQVALAEVLELAGSIA